MKTRMTPTMTVEPYPRDSNFRHFFRLGLDNYFFFPLPFPLLMIYEASAFGSGLSHLACYPLLSFAHSNPTN